MVKKSIMFFAVLCTLFSYSAQAKLIASVNKNPAVAGQPIVLTIESDNSHQESDLDMSALAQDLPLGHMSFSKSTQIINGDVSRQSTWTSVFYIDEPQTITIGPFKVGDELSESFELEVRAATSQQNTRKSKPAIFLESNLNNQEAYLGQILHYQLSLYINAELQNGQLSTPDITGLAFSQVGKDKDSIQLIDGKRYRVIERHFTVKLNQTGSFSIPAATFEGNIIVQNQGRQAFFSTRTSMPIRVKSQAINLEVLKPQAGFDAPWIVADTLNLTETWSEQSTEVEAGTPITRTLTLEGLNSDLDLIPPIELDLPKGVKSYPEKPVRTQKLSGQDIITTMKTSYAIIPRKAGTLVLPEIRLTWWDPQNEEQKWLTLPEKTFTITAAPSVQNNANAQNVTPLNTAPEHQAQAAASTQSSIWVWIAIAFAVLWLATLVLAFIYIRNKKSTDSTAMSLKLFKTKLSDCQFKQACDQSDVHAILQHTTPWFEKKLNKPLSLTHLQHLYPEIKASLTHLQELCYSKNQEHDFDGTAFYTLCVRCTENYLQPQHQSLTQLYPK